MLTCRCVHRICQVNPGILGGIVVDFGDKTIDLSVSSRVNKLNALLKGRLPLYCLLSLQVLIYIASRVRLDVLLLYRRVPLNGPMELSLNPPPFEPVLKQSEASWNCGLQSVNPPQLARIYFVEPTRDHFFIRRCLVSLDPTSKLSGWTTVRTKFYMQVLYVNDVLIIMGTCPCVLSSFLTLSKTGIRKHTISNLLPDSLKLSVFKDDLQDCTCLLVHFLCLLIGPERVWALIPGMHYTLDVPVQQPLTQTL